MGRGGRAVSDKRTRVETGDGPAVASYSLASQMFQMSPPPHPTLPSQERRERERSMLFYSCGLYGVAHARESCAGRPERGARRPT